MTIRIRHSGESVRERERERERDKLRCWVGSRRQQTETSDDKSSEREA
jgi:hypothetical protein